MRHNYLAILLCAVINFVVSNIWYGPLFGEKWYALHGIVMDKTTKTFTTNGVALDFNPIFVIFCAIAGALLSAFLLSYLFQRMGITNWKDGLATGVYIGLFTFVGIAVNHLFLCEPFSLTVIEGCAPVLLFALYGAMLGGWRKKE
jgi:hypothetical protein